MFFAKARYRNFGLVLFEDLDHLGLTKIDFVSCL
jgi:hypothetical protein